MKKLSRREWIAVAVSLVVVALFSPFFLAQFILGNTGADALLGSSIVGTDISEEVVVEDIVEGTGLVAQVGSIVSAHYTGMFEDGTMFDSSKQREPYTFQLGVGAVIPGWDKGVVGMKVGGSRRLVIPPALAYGQNGFVTESGVQIIPPNATIIFDIELVDVQ